MSEMFNRDFDMNRRECDECSLKDQQIADLQRQLADAKAKRALRQQLEAARKDLLECARSLRYYELSYGGGGTKKARQIALKQGWEGGSDTELTDWLVSTLDKIDAAMSAQPRRGD